jgi:DNA-binding protein YbaB
MDQKNNKLNDNTKEYFSKSKDKLIESHNLMLSTVTSFSDEDNLITLSMDNLQEIHEVNISDKLLISHGKKEIENRLLRLVNQAIFKSSINAANQAKKAVSSKELDKIISKESQGIKDSIEMVKKNIDQSLKNISSMTNSVVSKSGNLTLVISGTRMITSINISEEYLSEKNKLAIENELKETVNKAMQENLKEIQGLMKIHEDEFNKKI